MPHLLRIEKFMLVYNQNVYVHVHKPNVTLPRLKKYVEFLSQASFEAAIGETFGVHEAVCK